MTSYTLITGASQGIGEAFARLAASKGQNLILTARNESALETLAEALKTTHGIEVRVLPADLSEPGAAQDLWQAAEDHGRVGRLINNAGFGLNGRIGAATAEEHEALLEVNVTALTRLTYLALPHMQDHGGGRILNVASILAYLPPPFFATYGASKAYVLAFSEGLAKELAGSAVSVTALCPGTTRTGFFDRANMAGTKAAGSSMQSPEAVAQAGWDGMERGKPVVVPGAANKALVFGTRFSPRWTLAAVAKMLFMKS